MLSANTPKFHGNDMTSTIVATDNPINMPVEARQNESSCYDSLQDCSAWELPAARALIFCMSASKAAALLMLPVLLYML